MNRRQFFGVAGAAAARRHSWCQDLRRQQSFKSRCAITGLETDILHFPPGKVYYDAIHEFGAAHGGLVLRLQTDAGITGWASSSFGTEPGAENALREIVERTLRPGLVGQDPAFPKRLRADMWKALEYSGVRA